MNEATKDLKDIGSNNQLKHESPNMDFTCMLREHFGLFEHLKSLFCGPNQTQWIYVYFSGCFIHPKLKTRKVSLTRFQKVNLRLSICYFTLVRTFLINDLDHDK